MPFPKQTQLEKLYAKELEETVQRIRRKAIELGYWVSTEVITTDVPAVRAFYIAQDAISLTKEKAVLMSFLLDIGRYSTVYLKCTIEQPDADTIAAYDHLDHAKGEQDVKHMLRGVNAGGILDDMAEVIDEMAPKPSPKHWVPKKK